MFSRRALLKFTIFVVFIQLLLTFPYERIYHATHILTSSYLSLTRDPRGLVCSMLDLPGVISRSKTNVVFKHSLSQPKTLIVLAHYFDSIGIDNFQFFLAQGLISSSEYHFVVGINGPIPPGWSTRLNKIAEIYPNFEWFTHANYGFDFCIYKDVLHSTSLKISIADVTFFILLNKSMRGPFIPSYYEKPWPEIFTSKLTKKIKLSGTSVNCGDDGKITFHVQSMLWAFHSDILPLVLDHLECFHQKQDAIMKLEMHIPNIIINNGYRLASTMKLFESKEGIPDNNTEAICKWSKFSSNSYTQGDQYFPGMYAGIDVNPLEVVFFKSNRYVNSKTLQQYSAFTLMNNNFTVPAQILCD